MKRALGIAILLVLQLPALTLIIAACLGVVASILVLLAGCSLLALVGIALVFVVGCARIAWLRVAGRLSGLAVGCALLLGGCDADKVLAALGAALFIGFAAVGVLRFLFIIPDQIERIEKQLKRIADALEKERRP